ncbi:MAG: DUF1080 domain-containing protein [Lentisphaeraceae bacterium]|nr:DUF1080 domain-containing protein [Lentisphaeraceae bacterium]
MIKKLVSLFLLALACSVSASTPKAVDMFNGKDLSGWRNPYKRGTASVVGDEIHLVSKGGKFFLCTEKKYSDFIFEAEVKMPKGKSNSGFLFRCHVKPNRAFGYQAEVDTNERRWSGGLYDEGRRGWIHPIKNSKNQPDKAYEGKHWLAERKNAFKRFEWNKYKIRCVGNSIKIWVNGVLTTDLTDDKDAEGFIGLQHHGEKNKLYKFRNIKITELKKDK